MAGNKRNVFLDFIVNDRQARAGLQGVATEAGKTQSRFSKLSGGAKALVGGFAAIAATRVVAFLGEAARAAAEDQKAQELLKLAIQNSTDATDADITKTEDWIKKTSLAAGVADDELRPALGELVRTTGSLEEAQDALGVAMDIATAKGLPLESVTRAMGKAALGNVGALGRMGVATKNAAGETLTFDQVLQEASRTMGGATALAADTAEGKMRKFNVAMDEAKETLGNALIPVLAQGAEVITNMDKVLGFIGDKLADLPGPAGAFAEEVKGWLGPFGALNEIWGLAAEQVDKMVAAELAATEATDGLNDSMDNARHPTREMVEAHEDLAAAASDVAAAIRDIVEEQMAAASPAAAMLKYARELDEAQEGYNRALVEYGPVSDEAQDAATRLAEAQVNADAAAEMFATQGGAASIEALEDMLREGGALPETIDAIVNSLLGLNQTPIRKMPSWFGTVVAPDARFGARAHGGPVSAGGAYVVGEEGPEVLQMGGQSGHIIPNNQLGGGGGGSITNITVLGAGSLDVKRALERARRGLPF